MPQARPFNVERQRRPTLVLGVGRQAVSAECMTLGVGITAARARGLTFRDSIPNRKMRFQRRGCPMSEFMFYLCRTKIVDGTITTEASQRCLYDPDRGKVVGVTGSSFVHSSPRRIDGVGWESAGHQVCRWLVGPDFASFNTFLLTTQSLSYRLLFDLPRLFYRSNTPKHAQQAMDDAEQSEKNEKKSPPL